MNNIANCQCLLGLQCNDFVMLAADQTNTQSIVVMKHDENKLHNITDNLVMGVVGDPGVSSQFTQFVSNNLQLYKMRNGYGLDTKAIVHFTRKNLSDSLRTTPTIINLLIGGCNQKGGSQLYYLDFMATCVRVPFASHGFGGFFCLGIMDKYYKNSLTQAQAYELLEMCVHEIHQRLVLNLPNFMVKVVSMTGITELPVIRPVSGRY